MGYFAHSAWSYIDKKIEKLRTETAADKSLIFMVPALPEDTVLELAEHFSNHCIASGDIHLNLKIAQIISNSWSAAGIEKAKRHGWLDERGNLTYHRNQAPVPGKLNITILIGADKVTDAGGLSDFNWCDIDSVFSMELNGSFIPWVKEKLTASHIDLPEEQAHLNRFDLLLEPLLNSGKADILTIGKWLENLDLSSANNALDAQDIMLRSYDPFNLPKFTGFRPLLNKKNANLTPYIEKANAFFAYTLFLDPREKDKATKAIEKMLEMHIAGDDVGIPLDDQDIKGNYSSGAEFLNALKKYVQSEDIAEQEKLKQCDFVTIADKILKFKKKSEPKEEKKETLKKVSGSPIEMSLYALWKALNDFYRDNRFNEAEITKITLKHDCFKHDYDSAEDDSAEARTLLARRHLSRLLSGVDEFLQKHVDLTGPEKTQLPTEFNLLDASIVCRYASTAEPALEFSVYIHHSQDGSPFRCKFAWRLPETHSYRIAEDLLQWAKDGLAKESGTWKLPVFHMPYYEEFLHASDDEETRRVMLHAVRDSLPDIPRLTNMLSHAWVRPEVNDSLLSPLKALSGKYHQFINTASDSGLHAALRSDHWTELRQSFEDACRIVTDTQEGSDSQMTAMLMRAFLVTRARNQGAGEAWYTEPYEKSGIATLLHPAVLEMLEAQILFLFSCFNTVASEELKRTDRRKAFADKIWAGFRDLSSIESPVAGLLHNEDKNLCANVRGEDLIHRIGLPSHEGATLSTRLLLKYDNSSDEDEVSDIEMFRETRESRLLFNLLMDYERMHPHANDAISLAFFRNQDIQPVIAAIDRYLQQIATKRELVAGDSGETLKPYALTVTIFTESGDGVDVARWIAQWKERWEAAETEEKFKAYRNCRFSVSHRIVELDKNTSHDEFQRIIDEAFEADISVLYNFIYAGKGGNSFTEVAPLNITDRTLKFPILEKPFCSLKHPTDRFKRSRVITNQQFVLGALHTQIMHRLQNPGVQEGKRFVILGSGDFNPWRKVLTTIHKKSEWVICIDPNIDERLIRTTAGEGEKEREIIGFGSGVGSHGESNFTISTEQFSLTDVKALLLASIQEVYASADWTRADYEAAATSILNEAKELSGLSLVRATCVGNYIHDFMAYSLTRKLLRENRQVLCDRLVSLDAYRHWFDMADDGSRPDLMWLTAWLDDTKKICIDVRLIECKTAHESEEHLLKAKAQVNNGLQILVPAFAPKDPNSTEDSRPDQRYWWLQLHRLITSRTEIEPRSQKEVLSALEALADGDYKITWGAAVFAYWTDSKSDQVQHLDTWTAHDKSGINADIYAMGSEFVKKLVSGGSGYPLSWADWRSKAAKGEMKFDIKDRDVVPDKQEDAPEWGDDDGDKPAQQEPEPEQKPAVVAPVPNEPTAPAQPAAPAPAAAQNPAETHTTPKDTERKPVSIPQRIMLGKTVIGKPIYWEFGHDMLPNRHMVIFGTSGFGKTYAIQCLLSELARAGQNSLIIDYTDGFLDSKIELPTAKFLKPKQHYIQQSPLPILPFRSQVAFEGGMKFEDKPFDIAKRVAAIFRNVYALGNQQFPTLIGAITDGIKRHGDSFTLERLLQSLNSNITTGTYGTPATVKTTISKLKPFVDSVPFSTKEVGVGWENIFTNRDNLCQIFQFYKVDKHSAKAIIEFVLWDLYAFVSTTGNKNTPRIVVLDEAQNLDLGDDSPLTKYFTEGRKHGLALITATQTVKGVGGLSGAPIGRFFQAGHKLFFKPADNELREHAQLMHNALPSVPQQEWLTKLSSLQKGECLSLGQVVNEATGKMSQQAIKIKISSLEDRGFNA